MVWRKVLSLAFSLLVMGAMVSDAFAQRRPQAEWVLLGEQRVGFAVDRDVIRIAQSEDWYRTRAFRGLQFVAEGSDIYMLGLRLVYMNGYAEDFRIDRNIRRGDFLPVDLRGDRSYIRQIEMTYRARPSFKGFAVMKVYGEPARRGPGAGPGPGPERWEELGCKGVSLFGRDRDTVKVGRREGRFKAVRLYVRGADVEMLDLKIIYANGEPDDIPVRHIIRKGERTRALDLRGRERAIDRVEMVYRTVPNFKGLANVCVEGLQ